MSADDAIFVQRLDDGRWTAMWGTLSSDFIPEKEKAAPEEIFSSLDEAVSTMAEASMETEYGFRFPKLNDFGFRVELTEPVEADTPA